MKRDEGERREGGKEIIGKREGIWRKWRGRREWEEGGRRKEGVSGEGEAEVGLD